MPNAYQTLQSQNNLKLNTSYFDLIMVWDVSAKIGPYWDILETLCAGWVDNLIKLSEMLNCIPNIVNKNIRLWGDFNLFADTLLGTQGRNRALKRNIW